LLRLVSGFGIENGELFACGRLVRGYQHYGHFAFAILAGMQQGPVQQAVSLFQASDGAHGQRVGSSARGSDT
jgi:hypothetical protein